MGRWKEVEVKKVRIMKDAPRREKTEETREVVWRIRSSRVVNVITRAWIG